jgi:hypothetical protein
MKFTHTSPFQASLLGGAEHLALLNEPPPDAQRRPSQSDRVEAIMCEGYWRTLPGLAIELKRRFGQRYSETSISARLRELRRKGYQVHCERTVPGSGLYKYRAVKLEVANG